MPRPDSEEDDDALSLPGFCTPTKVIRNDGAGHAEPDAKGTESESDADVEKLFDESTGMLACEKVSTFVCNGSIQAAFFSTTLSAYVLFAIMTHFLTDYLQHSLT